MNRLFFVVKSSLNLWCKFLIVRDKCRWNEITSMEMRYISNRGDNKSIAVVLLRKSFDQCNISEKTKSLILEYP